MEIFEVLLILGFWGFIVYEISACPYCNFDDYDTE
jgi:hypothetical protein